MFLIVLGHVSCFMRDDVASPLFRTVMAPLSFFLAYHVNLFVLISGYCGIKSLKSIVKIWKLNFSWLLLIVLLNSFFLLGDFDYISLLFACSGSPWWFMQIYFLLSLVAPVLLNPCLAALDKKGVNTLLVVLLILDVYLSFGRRMDTIYFGGYDLIHFITIYVIGYWMKSVSLQKATWRGKELKARHFFYLFAAILLLKSVCRICLGYFDVYGRFWEYNNPFNIVLAVCAFLFFLKLRIRSSKGILFISSSVIGVYLFSEHPLIRDWLIGVFNTQITRFAHQPVGEFIYALLFVIGIFAVGIALDKVRMFLVDGLEGGLRKLVKRDK